jgi:hypothetical protein
MTADDGAMPEFSTMPQNIRRPMAADLPGE